MSKIKNNDNKDTFYNGMIMERNSRIQTQDEYELRKCGVQTWRKKRQVSEWDTITVIPVEIEVSNELDSFIKSEILDGFEMTYPMWIQQCFIERMKQILSDPAEFGRAVLESKKRGHLIQNVEDLEDC